MFKMKEVPKHMFMRTDEPHAGCLFITHRGARGGNDHQTPYLIVKDEGYKLLNLHSYQINYKGETIEELIENYLARNNDGLNPISDYFFARRWHSDLKVKDTFGWKETGFKRKSPKELMANVKRITEPEEAKKVLDNWVDKNK